MSLYQIENLTYYYPETSRPAVEGLNLKIDEGQFVLVTGESGCGKSTLARVLAGLIPDFYGGRIGGRVLYRGKDLRKMDGRTLAREVGMVFQDPEKQLVMTSVEAEIAFGLENLGLPREEMQWRVAEVISFLGLSEVKDEATDRLSGGQKQKLALGAVLAMQPQVLILDEPTSQLDPVAAEDFFNHVKRLNEELGFTIILIEQRLERCYHLADRVLLMQEGRIICDGTPAEVARRSGQQAAAPLPLVARLFATMGYSNIPVTVKEGRQVLRKICTFIANKGASPRVITPEARDPILTLKNVCFSYPGGRQVLENISLKIYPHQLTVLLGVNGAGKSTLLKVIVGLLKPDRGQVVFNGSRTGGDIGYLAQNPNDYLFQDTVAEELLFTLHNFKRQDDGIVDLLLARLGLSGYRDLNPRDLSSGERQRVALASVLVTRPRLLVLDEPTRGMDYRLKAGLGSFLQELAQEGLAVVVVTHDVDFAAEYASRVLMMFNGRIVSDGSCHQVLGQSVFFTTQIGKLCRGYIDGVLTLEEAKGVLRPLLMQPDDKLLQLPV